MSDKSIEVKLERKHYFCLFDFLPKDFVLQLQLLSYIFYKDLVPKYLQTVTLTDSSSLVMPYSAEEKREIYMMDAIHSMKYNSFKVLSVQRDAVLSSMSTEYKMEEIAP